MRTNDSIRENQLRQAIVEYGLKLQRTGLVTGTWGNLSVRFDENHMLCTPSGIDYSHITPEQIVMVNLDTLEWDGSFKPTSEKILHAKLYREIPEAGAIIHTHSTCATAYAVAGEDLKGDEVLFCDEFKVNGDNSFIVKCAEYGLAGTSELADKVCKAANESSFGCFMRSHGLIVYGSGLEDALFRARLVEDTAAKELDRLKKLDTNQN